MDHFVSLLLLLISHSLLQLPIEAKINGFSSDLIHRDSPRSPFYNRTSTSKDLAQNEAQRSVARANQIRKSIRKGSKLVSPLIPDNAEYLMTISIGNPPVEYLAIADTGSDLVWVQCAPCESCFPQESPPFDPAKSSTYKPLSCSSNQCQSLPKRGCSGSNQDCSYDYRYGDQSYTRGLLSSDTFTFDNDKAVFQDSVFGCGVNQGGDFSDLGSGLVGLGAGPLSLVSQLGSTSQIEPIFSYCLLPRNSNSASKLKFGADAAISGEAIVSTPLLSGEGESGTYYYLTLLGVSIEGRRIENGQPGAGAREGNIIIDSGTTLTILETNFYNEIEVAVVSLVGLPQVKCESGYNLCYNKSSFSNVGEFTIMFHFGGADVTLKTINIFREIGDMVCFTMIPSSGIALYGNWAQMNFQVEYDLARKQVSFAPADCTQF